MSNLLRRLMDTGGLPPLAYYFARFVARGCGADEDGLLARSAALVSLRNLQGDVCVDLGEYTGQPLFGEDNEASPEHARAPALGEWLEVLAGASWVGRPGMTAPLILDRQRLYLGKYWQYEQTVAEALRARLESVTLDTVRLIDGLRRLFREVQDEETDWQKVAAAIAVSRRFAVISGGPGTGKTTTVVKVLALLLEQDPGLHIALAAPTGKAAARLTEAIRGGKGRVDAEPGVLERIPEEASTLHRLLGAGFGSVFRYNRDNPLVLDCLVVDEASMIDLPLMARLLEALPEQSRLILLGDRDQLASVEAGNVLGDITGHGREIRYSHSQTDFLAGLGMTMGDETVPDAAPPARIADAVGLLRVSYRFAGDSGIGELARRVNAGEGGAAFRLLEEGRYRDIAWLDAGENSLNPACLDWAVDRYARYLQADDVLAALRAFEQARVLAALQGGPFGVVEINRRIAERLQTLGLIRGGEEYHGKPVMVTTNDYEVGLFNGDIGLMWRGADEGLRAWFAFTGNELRSVSIRQLPEHSCAYALTVHKSQGSEFEEVLLVLHNAGQKPGRHPG
jgi:exodeoxyribonuclease V alpha subunit